MDTITLLADRIDAARRWTRSLMDDIPDADYFRQVGPGLHHPAWIIGHLTWAEWALVAVRCLGRPPLPEPYTKLFGRGSTPSLTVADHPTPGALRAEFDRVHQEVLTLVRAFPPAQLDEPLGGDPHPMFSVKGQVLSMVAMHESFHAGQLALMRRLTGKAAKR